MATLKSIWYVRYFFWCCRVMDRAFPPGYFGNERGYMYQNGTNLCHFFRTLMWGTLFTTLSIGIYVYAIVVILVMPVVLFGPSSLGITAGVILGIVAVLGGIIGLILLVSWSIEKIHDALEDRAARRASLPERPPGLLSLFAAYLVGIKKRYCPTISFTYLEGASDE